MKLPISKVIYIYIYIKCKTLTNSNKEWKYIVEMWAQQIMVTESITTRFFSGSQIFDELWPLSKFNWRILNISWHLGYAISLQKLPSDGPCLCSQWTTLGPPMGAEGSIWKTLFYIKCEWKLLLESCNITDIYQAELLQPVANKKS